MAACNQSITTDVGFRHLMILPFNNEQLWTVNNSGEAFRHLMILHSLEMVRCSQATITDLVCSHFGQFADLRSYTQSTITGIGFRHMTISRAFLQSTDDFE